MTGTCPRPEFQGYTSTSAGASNRTPTFPKSLSVFQIQSSLSRTWVTSPPSARIAEVPSGKRQGLMAPPRTGALPSWIQNTCAHPG